MVENPAGEGMANQRAVVGDHRRINVELSGDRRGGVEPTPSYQNGDDSSLAGALQSLPIGFWNASSGVQ